MRHQNKLSLFGAVGALTLGTVILSAIPADKLQAKIIESTAEDIAEANAIEADGTKGGSRCNKLENVTTFESNSVHPVRGGKQAFRHWVDRCGERSEFRMKKTKIGETYWYGWSMFIPSDWGSNDPGFDIFS